MSEKQITVRVADRWRVVHPIDGTAHTKGDTLTVDENTAREWIDAGWVVEAKAAAPRKAASTRTRRS
jgi:hypothetical protein